MSMPNFLIIGAAKSGTTALYQYLKEHPQIYMSPVKEPKFFGLEGEKLDFYGPGDERANHAVVTDIDAYQALFQGISNETAIGEASTWYLYSQKAPRQIQNYIPEAKLIAVLRNPVDRAYSNFLHQIRNNFETTTDFFQALREEDARIHNNWRPFWHYKQMGFYYVQLNRYFQIFPRKQIQVYLYEDFCNKPIEMLQSIFQFLDVDHTFLPEVSIKYNIASIPKNRAVLNLLKKPNVAKSALKFLLPDQSCQDLRINIGKINSTPEKPQLSLQVRKQLIEEYREDILKLQELIQRDLSSWLTCSEVE